MPAEQSGVRLEIGHVLFIDIVGYSKLLIDQSIKLLQQLFATPGTGDALPPWYLRLDPFWDPLRSDPRFQKLLDGTKQIEPNK